MLAALVEEDWFFFINVSDLPAGINVYSRGDDGRYPWNAGRNAWELLGLSPDPLLPDDVTEMAQEMAQKIAALGDELAAARIRLPHMGRVFAAIDAFEAMSKAQRKQVRLRLGSHRHCLDLLACYADCPTFVKAMLDVHPPAFAQELADWELPSRRCQRLLPAEQAFVRAVNAVAYMA